MQENISRKQFGEFLEKNGWVTSDIYPDLGEDILVRIYQNGVSTGLTVNIQLKSVSDIANYQLVSGSISYPFEVKDLEHWEAQSTLIIMVVWDITMRVGWWISIKDAITYLQNQSINWRSKKVVKVHIPSANRLTEAELGKIRRIIADYYYPIISKDKGFDIQARFEFPPTPEGDEKRLELEKFFSAGDEVEIDGQYIKEFQLPDWWKRLYGEIDPKNMYVKLGPTKSPIHRPAQFDFSSPQIGSERIPYVDFRIVKAGQEEVTLSNSHQKIAMNITLIAKKEGGNLLQFHMNFAEIDVSDAQQALRINQIIAVGGSVLIKLLETGETIPLSLNPGLLDPVPDDILRFVNGLGFIQQVIGKPIRFPADGFYSQKDETAVTELVSIFTTGMFKQTGGTVSIELNRHGIEILLENPPANNSLSFSMTSDTSYVELFTEQIELGPMLQRFNGTWITPREQVESWLGLAQEDDTFVVKLTNVEMVEEFPDWLLKVKEKA